MAWNRPSTENQQSIKMKASPKWICLFLCLVVTIGVVIAFYVVSGGSSKHSSQVDIKRQAKVINGNVGRVQRKVSAEQRKPICSHRDFVATNEVKVTAKIAPPQIRVADIFLESKYVDGRPFFEKPMFTNHYENFVYGVLAAIPGERFIDVRLDSDFNDAFIESVNNPPKIMSGDSADIVEAKRIVIEATEKLKKYVQEGYLPSEVIADAREELNKIADYRDVLQDEFNKLIATGSMQEVEIFKREGDRLLEEYRAKPLEIGQDEIEDIIARDSATLKDGSEASVLGSEMKKQKEKDE